MSYQGQPGYQAPSTRTGRGKKVAIGCVITFVAFLALVGSCGALLSLGKSTSGGHPGNPAPGNPAPPDVGAKQVTYTVTGESGASITYGANGQTSQQTNAKLPWSITGPATGSFGFYMLSATNGLNADGEIRCRIEVDGKAIAENTSSGPYATVSCTGNA